MNLIEQLRESARLSAEATQLLAGAKSRRNQAAGDAGTHYEGGTPEQMIEWKAADEIERLHSVLDATHKLISEGAASEGFNPLVGTWADRLFANQAAISAALKTT